MRKILTIVAILLVIVGCTSSSEDESVDSVVGIWKLTSIKTMGQEFINACKSKDNIEVRSDKTFTITTVPRNKNKYSTSQSQNHWTSEPIFSSPWIIRKDWIRFREEPNVQSSRQIVIPPVAV